MEMQTIQKFFLLTSLLALGFSAKSEDVNVNLKYIERVQTNTHRSDTSSKAEATTQSSNKNSVKKKKPLKVSGLKKEIKKKVKKKTKKKKL